MNEANTPNNGSFNKPLNSANVPQQEQASCPFYSVLPPENRTNKQLPLLAPAEDKQYQENASYQDSVAETNRETETVDESECDHRVLELNQNQLEELEPEKDWVAEPDREQQAQTDFEFKQLLTLNEELRFANDDLYEQVEQLKVALVESQEALQWQKKRSSVTEAMLKQQDTEIATAQEQIKSLFQQLENALSTVQRQEILLESYKGQLEINQQRLAQLERECALIQTKYSEQSHQLLQSENACRELHTRLMRQQRQTLQFKAALEKCLDTTVPNSDSFDEDITNKRDDIISKHVNQSKRTGSILPNAQPIRPWSSPPESLADNAVNFWAKSSVSPLHKWDNPVPNQLFTTDTTTKESTPTAKQPPINSEINNSTPPKAISPSESSNLEEQLDSVIQTFFTPQPMSPSPQPFIEDIEGENVDIDITVTPILETVATSVEDDEEPVTTTLPTHVNNFEEYEEDYWFEPSPLPSSELPNSASQQKPFDDHSSNSNSPSPVLYPQRPPKKRKSLASIDLPNFRPNNQ